MSARAGTGRHDEEGKKEDVRHSGIGSSLRGAKIADGSVDEARKIAE